MSCSPLIPKDWHYAEHWGRMQQRSLNEWVNVCRNDSPWGKRVFWDPVFSWMHHPCIPFCLDRPHWTQEWRRVLFFDWPINWQFMGSIHPYTCWSYSSWGPFSVHQKPKLVLRSREKKSIRSWNSYLKGKASSVFLVSYCAYEFWAKMTTRPGYWNRVTPLISAKCHPTLKVTRIFFLSVIIPESLQG